MSDMIAAAATAPKDIPAISWDDNLWETGFRGVALGSEVFDSEVAVAAIVDEPDDDDIVAEDEEGVVVGRMRIEVGIALVVDSVTIGVPEAVRMDVILLELVVAIELVTLLEAVGDVVVLAEVDVTGGWLVVEVLETVASGVLSELVSKLLVGLSCVVVSDVKETTLLAVEDVNEDEVETLLAGTAAITCSPVFEALAATPGVIAWLTATVADESSTNAVVVFETGEAEGDLEDDKTDDVEIDRLVTLLLVNIRVDIVVGIEVMIVEELIAGVAIDDRDKLDVVEKVVLFRLAVEVLMSLDADKDESAGIVVNLTTVVNKVKVDFASIVSLESGEILWNKVEVDVIVVIVVVWFFEGDLGGRATSLQAERAYKHWITIFVQEKPYRSLLWRPLLDGSESIQRTTAYSQATWWRI
jgi:hypothetical protein